MHDYTRCYFKLRQNIELEGDVDLARMELQSLVESSLTPIHSFSDICRCMPSISNLNGLSSPSVYARPTGIQGFIANVSAVQIPTLINSLSFIERIYIELEDRHADINYIDQQCPCLSRLRVQNNGITLLEAIPRFAFFEFSKAALKRANTPSEVKSSLAALLKALFGYEDNPAGKRLALNALNAKNTSAFLSHDIHYYKAKFFPRMARALINIGRAMTNKPNANILDNFVGSGTTLLEASMLGMSSVGVDLDPLSALISNIKIGSLNYSSYELSEAANMLISNLESQRQGQLTLTSSCRLLQPMREVDLFPSWLMKNRKMTSKVSRELADEINLIRTSLSIVPRPMKGLLQVLISDAVTRKIKMRVLGTGSGRFSLTFAKTPLSEMLYRSIRQSVKTAAAAEWMKDALNISVPNASALVADARRLPIQNKSIDIIVTSPPYLPASSGRESYAKARAVSLRTIGAWDVDNLISNAVGSMSAENIDISSLSRKEADAVVWLQNDESRRIKAAPTAHYFMDMRASFHEMYRVMKKGGFAALVSGKQSAFYKFSTRELLYVVPAAEILAESAQDAGFCLHKLVDIQLKKSNRNARPRSLDDYYETIIMLRKP